MFDFFKLKFEECKSYHFYHNLKPNEISPGTLFPLVQESLILCIESGAMNSSQYLLILQNPLFLPFPGSGTLQGEPHGWSRHTFGSTLLVPKRHNQNIFLAQTIIPSME